MPADYNIPMTDAQITEALQLMVERVSEGWAQGTYDGSPVGSGSPYYQNNSKYWATRATDAAARAEAAVPAGTAGAVFFDRAQTLTDAQAMQARQNIKAGGSNPNLLDNPWFTVNQRGQASYSTAYAYSVDRWVNRGGTITVVANGIQWVALNGHYFSQPIEPSVVGMMAGKTVTASILFADGTIKSHSFVAPQSGSTYSDNYAFGATLGLYLQNNDGGSYAFLLRSAASTTFAIKAMKLELGSASTLLNDTLPNYTDELLKCISSTADPIDTYANKPIGATPNPNLLDNPWFTINQRGQTTYTGRGYTADRWIELSTTTTVTVNSSGLTFTSDASMGLHQWFDDTFLVGKAVTLSILYQDGKMSTKSFVWPSSGSRSYNDGLRLNVYYGTVYQSHHGIAFIHNTASVAIRAVKLELGSVSTLANDTAPNYQQELAKCQFNGILKLNEGYFLTGRAINAAAAVFFVPWKHRAGDSGTSYVSGLISTIYHSGGSITVSANPGKNSANTDFIRLTVTGLSGLTAGESVIGEIGTNGLIVSNDL